MRLVWSERAQCRLDEEAESIARSRPSAVRLWLDEIDGAVERLERYPLSGRVLPEFPRMPVREVIHGGFRIVYLPEPDRIVIVTVKHSRQKMRRKDVNLRTLM